MKRSVLAISTAIFALLSLGTPAFAQQYGGQYGNNPTAGISINKTVKDPTQGVFVDNLGVNDTRFQAGDTITFRLEVTNNGSTTFKYVDVKDTLPPYVEFVSGPGEYNTSNKQITYRINNFEPGKTDTKEITGRIMPKAQLPQQQAVFCVVNASSLTTNDNRTASDNAQFCIGTSLAKELPKTGPIFTAMLFGAVIFGGGIVLGFLLRKAKR